MSYSDTRDVNNTGTANVDFSAVNANIASNDNEIGLAFNSVLVDPNNGSRLLFGFPDDNGTKTSVSLSGGGTNGTNGVDGTNGIDGTNGTNGVDGKNGTNGVDGNDGDQGIQGVQGVAGSDGTNGTNGVDGTNGTNGVDGTNGTNGVDGTNGTNGVDGTDGTNGTNGIDGIPTIGNLSKLLRTHPDIDADLMTSWNPLVEGRQFYFYESTNGEGNVHRYGFQNNSSFWKSSNTTAHQYSILDSGIHYNHVSSNEYIGVGLPEPIVLHSYTISAEATENLPRSFKMLGSHDNSTYNELGVYTDVTVATTDAGSVFERSEDKFLVVIMSLE